MILAGAIPAALMAILLDFLLSRFQTLSLTSLRKILYVFAFFLLLMGTLYIYPEVNPPKLLAGFTPEFMGRQDGDLGLRSVYGLKIKTSVVSDAVMYKAAYEKELDVISGYSTDGRLKAYDLKILKDDREIFPPYHAAPIVNRSALKRFPDLEHVLDLLAGKISDSIMTDLNYRTDYLHQTPEHVAKVFLIANKLYKQPRGGDAGTIRIGSKIFGEQYILAQIYRMLIEGNTNYKVATKSGLGGTKICFDALVHDQIDFYPEYTGTGLLVILQASSEDVKRIGNDKQKVYGYVKARFMNDYKIQWLKPIGFQQLIRIDDAEKTV